jgi:2-methylisocitrate lyase-like PEP mutase family enzyme
VAQMNTARETQAAKAEQFRRWHNGEEILILPCAWDVASAGLFEAEGFKAIGTTSAGIAASLGYADGQKVPFEEHLRVLQKIAAHVRAPVSVDIEAGYATTIEGVTANVREVLHSGVVGINIEDENHSRSGGQLLEPVPFMVQKIEALRAMSRVEGVPMVINAKTDAIWLSVGDGVEDTFKEAVRRANAYGAAGADCVFIPGDLDLQTVSQLVKAILYPLNIVVKAGTPSVATLHDLGVRRVSLGSGPMRAAMGLTRRIAREVLSNGTYQTLLELAIPFDEVQCAFRN